MRFNLEDIDAYYRENEKFGILFDRKRRKFYKISDCEARKIKEEKNLRIFDSESRLGLFDKSLISRVELIMTTSCNLECKYCFANEGNYNCKIQNIKKEVLDKVIEWVQDNRNSIQEIIFFGGEPTLAEDEIDYFCRSLNGLEKDISYKMVTNLYRLTPR
ncbi:hypothetical protein C815_02014 [Firmicutes bacterium M10-2]|nr:hypothetical protein C815_02014 [Firmicutes bacterium M10-2]